MLYFEINLFGAEHFEKMKTFISGTNFLKPLTLPIWSPNRQKDFSFKDQLLKAKILSICI